MMNVGTILDDHLDVTEQQGKSSSLGKDTDAEVAEISKNGSDYDITIIKSSHDKEEAEVQWSNNELFENILDHNHEVGTTNEDIKALKEANDLLTKDLKMSTLFEFAINHILGNDDSSPSSITESNISELKKESGENICENAKCELQTKIVKLEKVLTQKTKDFDDVKLELSNRTAKFEAYFEKLENTKVVLERQLARKVDDYKAEKDQFLKEVNHLRTQLENLKGKSVETKFDKPSILGIPPSNKLLINS
ncbi:hypothetical protein Tco_0281195 [Tanacetum coccineum]